MKLLQLPHNSAPPKRLLLTSTKYHWNKLLKPFLVVVIEPSQHYTPNSRCSAVVGGVPRETKLVRAAVHHDPFKRNGSTATETAMNNFLPQSEGWMPILVVVCAGRHKGAGSFGKMMAAPCDQTEKKSLKKNE